MKDLLGAACELALERRVSRLRLPSGEAYSRLFSSSYGPTKTLSDSLDAERRAELDRTWVDFFRTNYGRDGQIEHHREYLLVFGVRR